MIQTAQAEQQPKEYGTCEIIPFELRATLKNIMSSNQDAALSQIDLGWQSLHQETNPDINIYRSNDGQNDFIIPEFGERFYDQSFWQFTDLNNDGSMEVILQSEIAQGQNSYHRRLYVFCQHQPTSDDKSILSPCWRMWYSQDAVKIAKAMGRDFVDLPAIEVEAGYPQQFFLNYYQGQTYIGIIRRIFDDRLSNTPATWQSNVQFWTWTPEGFKHEITCEIKP